MARPALVERPDIHAGELAGGQCGGPPCGDTAIKVALHALIANAHELHNGLASSLLVFDQDHQRRVEGKNPANVGGEGIAKFDIERARNMLAGKSVAWAP